MGRSFEKYRPYFDQPRNGQKLGTSSGLNRNNDKGYKSHNPSPCPSQTVSGKMSSRGSKSTNHKVTRNIEHSVSQSTKLWPHPETCGLEVSRFALMYVTWICEFF